MLEEVLERAHLPDFLGRLSLGEVARQDVTVSGVERFFSGRSVLLEAEQLDDSLPNRLLLAVLRELREGAEHLYRHGCIVLRRIVPTIVDLNLRDHQRLRVVLPIYENCRLADDVSADRRLTRQVVSMLHRPLQQIDLIVDLCGGLQYDEVARP